VRPATVTVPGVGVVVGGIGGVADEELCDVDVMAAVVGRYGLGWRPREGTVLEHPERDGEAMICSRRSYAQARLMATSRIGVLAAGRRC